MRNRIGILISLFLFAGVMLSQQQPASSAPSNAQSSNTEPMLRRSCSRLPCRRQSSSATAWDVVW